MPFLFKHMGMQMLQLPDKIMMIFSEDHEVREVRLNAAHPALKTRRRVKGVQRTCYHVGLTGE